MIVIRTAEELAEALVRPLPPTLQQRLQQHRDRLAEYELEELAHFAIVQPHDSLDDLGGLFPGGILLQGGSFSIEPELIDTLHGWIELTFIVSDCGFGIIVFIEQGSSIERQLAPAIESSLAGRDTAFLP